MADYKSPDLGLTSLSDLLNIISHIGDTSQNTINEGIHYAQNYNQITTLEGLNNILPNIKNYNQEAVRSGDDELQINWQDKSSAFNIANHAYTEGRGYLDGNLGDSDALYNDIMGYSWQDTNKEIAKLQGIIDGIGQGETHKFQYKGDGIYNATSIKNAVAQRIGMLQNKLAVFAENEGEFLVYNPDGTMDETSQMIYDDLQYKILMGNPKEFEIDFNTYVDTTSKQFNNGLKSYYTWASLEQQIASKTPLDDLDVDDATMQLITNAVNTGETTLSGNMLLDPGWVTDRKNDAIIAAEKYNNQFNVLTGNHYMDITSYPWRGETTDGNIPGTIVANPANLTGNTTPTSDGTITPTVTTTDDVTVTATSPYIKKDDTDKPDTRAGEDVKRLQAADDMNKDIFDTIFSAKNTGAPTTKIINDLAEKYGKNYQEILDLYSVSENKYADEIGVKKGEFDKSISGAFTFIPPSQRTTKQIEVSTQAEVEEKMYMLGEGQSGDLLMNSFTEKDSEGATQFSDDRKYAFFMSEAGKKMGMTDRNFIKDFSSDVGRDAINNYLDTIVSEEFIKNFDYRNEKQGEDKRSDAGKVVDELMKFAKDMSARIKKNKNGLKQEDIDNFANKLEAAMYFYLELQYPREETSEPLEYLEPGDEVYSQAKIKNKFKTSTTQQFDDIIASIYSK